MTTADDFERDYYFRVPHPTAAWSILEVNVKQVECGWLFAYGYQLPTCGMGTPFKGPLPSREAAGRNGLLYLRDALRRFAGDGEVTGRDNDQKEAKNYSDQIQERLFPAQPELFAAGSMEGGAA